MTMGASVECRVPFLDYRLVEGVAALPSAVLLAGRERKHLLRQAVGARLPPTVLSQRKWGFGVPWSRYLRVAPALRALVERLPRKEPIASGPFERAAVSSVVRRFLAGDQSTNALVQQLVMVSTWHDACVTRRPSVSGFPVRPVVDVRPDPQASGALRARR
jgi:asparagine synthase (glutamine-hydrolysing)